MLKNRKTFSSLLTWAASLKSIGIPIWKKVISFEKLHVQKSCKFTNKHEFINRRTFFFWNHPNRFDFWRETNTIQLNIWRENFIYLVRWFWQTCSMRVRRWFFLLWEKRVVFSWLKSNIRWDTLTEIVAAKEMMKNVWKVQIMYYLYPCSYQIIYLFLGRKKKKKRAKHTMVGTVCVVSHNLWQIISADSITVSSIHTYTLFEACLNQFTSVFGIIKKSELDSIVFIADELVKMVVVKILDRYTRTLNVRVIVIISKHTTPPPPIRLYTHSTSLHSRANVKSLILFSIWLDNEYKKVFGTKL